MLWECPICGKKFRNRSQWHSCARWTPEDHLKGKPEVIQEIYLQVMGAIRKWGPFETSAVRNSIQLRVGANFLSIRLMQNRVELEFFSGNAHDRPPVYFTYRISGNRILHRAACEKASDVTPDLLRWIKESRTLVASSRKSPR